MKFGEEVKIAKPCPVSWEPMKEKQTRRVRRQACTDGES